MWLLVAALAIPAGGPATARDSGPADTEPDAARFLFDAPVAWNVFLQRTGEARHLAVDAARGRVLATAYVSASSDTRFFVLDFAGTELGNVSIGPWGASYGARIAVDPDTGYAYVSGDLGGIVKVDPSGPSVLARWSYDGFYPRAIAILGGVLYVTQDYDLGPGWPIAEIDAASGAYLGNLTAGRYLFVRNKTVLRVSLSDGGTFAFWYDATFAPSLDGHRIYLCLKYQTTTRFGWYSLDANTSQFIYGGCGYSTMATNPVTDVVASAGGLNNETGRVGRVDTGTPYAYTIDVGWSAVGKALFGILDRPGSDAFEVGAWAGTPRFVPPYDGNVVVFRPGPVCVDFVSVSGLNWTSLTTYMDGAVIPHDPWTPSAQAICVDASGVPDGRHTLRAAGLDALGQPLDTSWTFATDTTPPIVTLTSPAVTATLPYTMTGVVNETHIATLYINNIAVVTTGGTWSLIVRQMHLGANAFQVSAFDSLGNWGESTLIVRYWPAYTDFVRSGAAHFAVPVPPDWTRAPGPLPGGVLPAINLVGPPEPPLAATVSAASIEDLNATSGAAYAVGLAQAAQAFIVSNSGTILEAAQAFTVAGHSAANFTARVTLSGVVQRYIEAVIVAPEWKRVYIVTAAIPEATWSNHPEDLAWILAGFQIDAAPPAPPGAEALPVPWEVFGLGAAAGAATVLAVLWRRRRKGPSAADPGFGATGRPPSPLEGGPDSGSIGDSPTDREGAR